jgi:hypothetical protein
MIPTLSHHYIKVLWTCGMGDKCTNATRPGTHDEYLAASRCYHALEGREEPPNGNQEPTTPSDVVSIEPPPPAVAV